MISHKMSVVGKKNMCFESVERNLRCIGILKNGKKSEQVARINNTYEKV